MGKVRKLLFLLFSIIGVVLNAQMPIQPPVITLNLPDGGINRVIGAKEKLILDPGFSYGDPNSNFSFLGYVDPAISTHTSYSPLFTAGQFNARTTQTNLPVGFTPGVADVTRTGGASYVVPIQVPKGTNGMEPSISIAYNSQGGDGLLGIGWDIAGLSVISRVSKTIYHNNKSEGVQYDMTDNFALDGNRLFTISGSYGNNNTVYATEQETFTRITSLGSLGVGKGPRSFKVETKEGLTMYYGATDNARVLHTSSGTAVLWRLNKIEDNYGNYVLYQYINDGIQSRIAKILYTGNNNIQPYNVINFYYDYRSDFYEMFDQGLGFYHRFLLNKIAIESEGELVKEYTFDYGMNHNSFLREIKESGANQQELNSTIFQYGAKSSTIQTNFQGFYTGSISNSDIFPGDYNGDGITDMLVADFNYVSSSSFKLHTNTHLYLCNSNGYFTHVSTENLPQNTTLVKNQHTPNIPLFMASDFNGDGSDDLMIIETNPQGNVNKIDVFTLNTHSNTRALLCSYVPVDGFNRTGWSLNRFWIGDFDGDGAMDLMYYLSNGGHFRTYIMFPNRGAKATRIILQDSQTNQNFLHDYLDKYHIIDHDGDGVSDLMVITNTVTKIFKINLGDYKNIANGSIDPPSFVFSNDIYSGSFPSKDHDIHFGDFNGDGKTDLLTRFGTNLTFNIEYSTGKHYLGVGTVTMQGNGSSHNFYVADFNGDGKSDILHSYKHGVTGSHCDFYYSKGFSLHSTSHVFERNANQTVNQSGYKFYLGDFNGDGKMDFIDRVTNVSNYTYLINRFSKDRLLTRIKNGFNEVTTFNYDILTERKNYTQGWNHFAYPLTSLNLSIPLITSVSVSNGIGGIDKTDYEYSFGAWHKQGKGFLGFEQLITRNANQGITTVTTNRVNDTYYTMYNTRQSSSGAGEIISTVETKLSFINIPSSSICPRYWVRTDQVKQTVPLKNAISITDYEYLNANTGNLIKSINTTGNTVTTVEYEQYVQKGSWIPNVPSRTKLTVNRDGDTQGYPKLTFYEYNNQGSVTNVSNGTTAKSSSTSYEYDAFGNVRKSTVASLGIAESLTTEYLYDSRGRHQTRVINPLGQSTYYDNYDKRWSKPTSIRDVNNLTTTYKYDHFGRLIESTDPQNVTTNIYYQWAISSGSGVKEPTRTRYRVRTISAGKPEQIVWYDALGREVKTGVRGLDNTMSYTVAKFNAKGQQISVTEPFYETTPSVMLSTTNYDGFGRVTSTQTGNYTTTYSYQTLSGTDNKYYSVTTTEPGGTQRTTIYDANGLVVEASDPGGTLSYEYYPNGLQKAVKMGGITITQMEYDVNGHQTKLIDQNGGTIEYDYDAFGRLLSQKDALNHQHVMTYDKIGRILTRTGPEGLTQYEYITSGNGLNQLKKVTGFNGYEENHTYDMYGRMIETEENIDGQLFKTSYAYNQYNQLRELTYPSGFKIENFYNTRGYLTAVSSSEGGAHYQYPQKNARGQLTSYRLGNGKDIEYEYDQYGRMWNHSIHGANYYGLSYEQDRNLIATRVYDRLSETQPRLYIEEFTYDNQQRLTDSRVRNIMDWSIRPSIQTQYGANGNITHKTDAGSYTYASNKPNAVVGLSNVLQDNISPMQQNITYTTYDRTAQISEGGYQLDITYGASYDRTKTQLSYLGNTQYTRYYSGLYEKTIANDTTYEVHYIPTGDGSNVLYVKTNGVGAFYYVYKDHLGSYNTITDDLGNIVYEQNFDAWGREREPLDLGYNNLPQNKPKWLSRGYTAHEMLPEFGLVNMNNRMYDPVLGRMLAVDNYVSDPFNTQGYNRYSYCFNNPISYTDPDGEWVHIAIGAAVGGVMNLATNWNNVDNFWEGLAAFGAGAGSGAMTAAFGPLGALAGGALTGATNNVIAQTGNGVGLNQLNWGQVGLNAGVGGVAGIAGYGAGQLATNNLGSAVINGFNVSSPVISGVINGIIGGAAGGAAGGFTAGFLFSGGDVNIGLQSAWGGLKSGAVTGGALGGAGGYIDAKHRGINPWNGKDNQPITPSDLRGVTNNTTIEKNGRQFDIKPRTQKPSTDGATSYHVFEIVNGDRVSVTHMVISPKGLIIHQHQYFIGQSGDRYYNPNLNEFPTLKLLRD